MTRFAQSSVVLFLAICAIATLVRCGGSNITFPQGPTSGIEGLGFVSQLVHIEPNVDFDLQTSFNSSLNRFEFSWQASPDKTCAFYRVIVVVSPLVGDPGVTSVMQVFQGSDTAGLTANGTEELTNFVSTSSQQLSALVLCFEDANAPVSSTVFPRSDFSYLNGFL